MHVRRTLVAAVVAGATLLGAGAAAVAQQDSIGDDLLRSLGLEDDQVAEAQDEVDALLDGLVEAGILDEEELDELADELADIDVDEDDPLGDRFREAAELWDDWRDDFLDEDELAAWDEVRDEFELCLDSGADLADCGFDVSDEFDEVWSDVDEFGDEDLFGEFFDGDFYDFGPGFDDGFEDDFGPGFDDGFEDDFGPGFDDGFEDDFGPGFDDGFEDDFGPGMDDDFGDVDPGAGEDFSGGFDDGADPAGDPAGDPGSDPAGDPGYDPAGDPGYDDPYEGSDAEEAA